jgi:transcriptional regulator with XRE-family HTH domain
MTVSEKLQRLCRLANKAAVAKAAGITENTLGAAIAGTRRPHNATLKALASVLEVDAEWLCDDSRGLPVVRVVATAAA